MKLRPHESRTLVQEAAEFGDCFVIGGDRVVDQIQRAKAELGAEVLQSIDGIDMRDRSAVSGERLAPIEFSFGVHDHKQHRPTERWLSGRK